MNTSRSPYTRTATWMKSAANVSYGNVATGRSWSCSAANLLCAGAHQHGHEDQPSDACSPILAPAIHRPHGQFRRLLCSLAWDYKKVIEDLSWTHDLVLKCKEALLDAEPDRYNTNVDYGAKLFSNLCSSRANKNVRSACNGLAE